MSERSAARYDDPIDRQTVSVLLADPAIDTNSAIVQQLACKGFEVFLASTTRAAHSFVSTRTLDFVLLELQFDDGDCFPLIEEIRLANPNARILIHSALCSLPIAVRAAKAGANDVLPKPVQADFVVALLLGEDAQCNPALGQPPTPNAVMSEHIKTVYSACDSNITKTARQLSMHRRTLQRMLARTRDLTIPSIRTPY